MLKQRMYNLVIYQLSPIQKGIQAYHSAIEYSIKYRDNPEYKQWSEQDKTVIILDGGTVTDVYNTLLDLTNMKVPISSFVEPDLGEICTSLAFLVDERVWDTEKYPNPTTWCNNGFTDGFHIELSKMYGPYIAYLRKYLSRFKLAI